MSARRLVIAAVVGAAAVGAAAGPALAQPVLGPGTVDGRVLDASTGAPAAHATVLAPADTVRTGGDGTFRVRAAPGDTLRVRRIGFRTVVVVAGGSEMLVIALVPATAARVARLDPVAVTARPGDAEARLAATLATDEARRLGAATLADAVATLPFVAARSAQGSTVVSLRGARPEQVVVTLDGLPLNDPATGRADLSDVPLAALAGITAAPGADALGAGPGASGGVLALASGSRPVLAAAAGAFGLAQLEGAGTATAGGGTVRVGAALRTQRNDFAFVNRDAGTGSDSVERRVNADERRGSLFASAVLPRAQLLVLASAAERGMAGPMNVRAYDEDRGRTARLVARAAVQPGAWSMSTAIRLFRTAYDDPRQPANGFRASSRSGDVDVARAAGAWTLRAGAGVDDAGASGLARRTTRGRGFAVAAWAVGGAQWRATAGARADAVGGAGARVSPSASVERALGDPAGAPRVYARVAQAFRAPTLYDLYFASPQRVLARPLRPERVTVDAELGVRAAAGPVGVEGAAFTRRTRDAIVWFPGNFGWSPANVGRERAAGAELRAVIAPRPTSLGLVSARGWGGVYSAQLDVARTVGPRLVIPTPYVARASGGATAELRRGPGFLATTVQALGRRPFASAPASRAYELPAVALVGLRAGATFGGRSGRLLVTVGADNVGAAEWQSVRGYPTPGRAWSLGVTLDP